MWVLLHSRPQPDLMGFAPHLSLDTFVIFFCYDVDVFHHRLCRGFLISARLPSAGKATGGRLAPSTPARKATSPATTWLQLIPSRQKSKNLSTLPLFVSVNLCLSFVFVFVPSSSSSCSSSFLLCVPPCSLHSPLTERTWCGRDRRTPWLTLRLSDVVAFKQRIRLSEPVALPLPLMSCDTNMLCHI